MTHQLIVSILAGALLASPLATTVYAKGGDKSGEKAEKKVERKLNKVERKVEAKALKHVTKELKREQKQLRKTAPWVSTSTTTEESVQGDSVEVTGETETTAEGEVSEAPVLPVLRRVKNGAQFTYNPTTGLVTLTTPSGKVHTLSLPQTAITNMFRNAVPVEDEDGEDEVTPTPSPTPEPTGDVTPTPSPEPTGTTEETGETETTTQTTTETGTMTETTNVEGQTVVTQNITEQKFFMGIIPVKSAKTVVINTNTGEVTVEKPKGLFFWIIDTLSR